MTAQEDDKYSKVLQFNDYTMVIAKRDAFVTYLYAVHDDEFWDEIDQTDYVPLNRENQNRMTVTDCWFKWKEQ